MAQELWRALVHRTPRLGFGGRVRCDDSGDELPQVRWLCGPTRAVYRDVVEVSALPVPAGDAVAEKRCPPPTVERTAGHGGALKSGWLEGCPQSGQSRLSAHGQNRVPCGHSIRWPIAQKARLSSRAA